MLTYFDKPLIVKVDNELGVVNLSVKVTEMEVSVYKFSLNDFIVMVADFNSQLPD
jgi:hypothetical protein